MKTLRDASKGSLALHKVLLRGGASLTAAVCLERGLAFLANCAAARVAGPQTFGTYATVLATAGTVATYAGAGVGATATRFAGQHPVGSSTYRDFRRVMTAMAAGCALLACIAMLAGSRRIAAFMFGDETLAVLLRIGALSAVSFVLSECVRGLFSGQLNLRGLWLLSAVSGVGVVLMLPPASRMGAGTMLGAHAVAGLLGVTASILIAPSAAVTEDRVSRTADAGAPLLRSMAGFAAVQLGSVLGISGATWFLAALVARADPSLREVGLYAVSNQLRSLVVVVPGVISQIGYPLLSDEMASRYGGSDRVVLSSALVSGIVSLLAAGGAIAALPWVLSGLYGAAYSDAEVPAALLLASAVIHMSGSPAANRLSIAALPTLGVINGIWSALVLLVGLLVVPAGGAAGAGATFLLAHVISQCLVLWGLRRRRVLPKMLLPVALTTLVSGIVLGAAGVARAWEPSLNLPLTGTVLAATVVACRLLLRLSRVSAETVAAK